MRLECGIAVDVDKHAWSVYAFKVELANLCQEKCRLGKKSNLAWANKRILLPVTAWERWHEDQVWMGCRSYYQAADNVMKPKGGTW